MKNMLRHGASRSVNDRSVVCSGSYPSATDCKNSIQNTGSILCNPLPQQSSDTSLIQPVNSRKQIWIDIINPSDVLFFNALMHDLTDCQIAVTYRERAETVNLGHSFGIEGAIVGKDSTEPITKIFQMGFRTARLFRFINHFDCSMSFENGMSTLVSKMRGKTSFQFCDNDLKFIQKTSRYQDLEMKIKLLADYLIVPRVCSTAFKNHVDGGRLVTYDGYKEDVYIADYIPDPCFLESVPYKRFVVVRPEALDAFYVKEKRSIVPAILRGLVHEGVNVIYLPRTLADRRHADDSPQVFIPDSSLNGLDLCHYADAVLTGSGTMAREAACMGKRSVSFFPGEHLLSVDRQLVDDKRVFHSRDPDEIVAYGLEKSTSWQPANRDMSRAVKQSVVRRLKTIISGN